MASKAEVTQGIKTWHWAAIAAVTALTTATLTALSGATTGFADAGRDGGLSPALIVHLATVVPALPLGAYLLIRRKGDRLHRLLGRVWAGLMLTTAVATFWLTGPEGGLSFIHIFSVVTFISIPRAIFAIRRGDLKTHRYAIAGSYIGLIVAGAFAFAPGRLLHNWIFG